MGIDWHKLIFLGLGCVLIGIGLDSVLTAVGIYFVILACSGLGKT